MQEPIDTADERAHGGHAPPPAAREPGHSRGLSPELAALVRAEVERQLGAARRDLEAELAALRARTPDDKAAIVVFSGDLDKLIAGFVIATGAAAMGLETAMFFTFWGLSSVRRKDAERKPKDLYERLFGLMTPGSSHALGVSKGNYFGAGAAMLRGAMKKKEISSLEDLIELARESGVKMTACAMSMDVMGVRPDELLPGVELGGVAAYLGDAASARVTLFI